MNDPDPIDDLLDDVEPRTYLTLARGKTAITARPLIATSDPDVVEAAVRAVNRAVREATSGASRRRRMEVVRS